MSYSFPKGEADGFEVTLSNGVTYRYNKDNNLWQVASVEGTGAGEVDLPPMTSNPTADTLVLRDENANAKFRQITCNNMTFNQDIVFTNTAETWFLSGGELSNHGVKKNTAEGMRASLNIYSKDEVDALSGGGGGGGGEAAWTYYPDEYRFGNMGIGGYDLKEFWVLSAETIEDFEGTGGDPANRVTEKVLVHDLRADRIWGHDLRITAKDLVLRTETDGYGTLEVHGQSYFRHSFSAEHTVLGGINITGLDADRPDELPYSADEKSVQYALSVDHQDLGRTVEITKEGTIRANAFTDMEGNPIGGGGVEEAPEDNSWYGRKNAGWTKAPAYSKAQAQRMANLHTAVFRQPAVAGATSNDFELSNGPLTRAGYVENEVGQTATVTAKWIDYDTITFNKIQFSLRHTEVGDLIEIGDADGADKTGVILKVTSVQIEEADGLFSGSLCYELIGRQTANDFVQKNKSYMLHLHKMGLAPAPSDNKQYVQKNGEWVEFDPADAMKGPTYSYAWQGWDGAVSNRPGHLNTDAECTEDVEFLSFYPQDSNSVGIPAEVDNTWIIEVTSPDGKWAKYRPRGGSNTNYIQCDRIEASDLGVCAMFFQTESYEFRMYEEPAATRQIGRSDLVQTFTELQHAIADEKTMKGLKEALHNALGGLIEKFEG
jgi:hypothetical protein